MPPSPGGRRPATRRRRVPGPYEIGFEGVGTQRFLPIPSRRLEERAGESAEVIVDLRRK
ncbi:MAG: hypothetical protein AAF628_25495 [Planctomycetota bacterium]